jgi:hypothetical protein
LEREDLAQIPRGGSSEAVHEGGVDLTLLQQDPGLVQRPGPVHLDVGLGPRRPHAHGVEGADERERSADQVVGRPRADEPDVVLGDADVAEHLGDHRHEHLDLVVLALATHIVVLGERHHRDRSVTRGQPWKAAHKYSL